MNKIKKVFTSFSIFFTGMLSKVWAVNTKMYETKYGIIDPRMVEDKYGVFEPQIMAEEKSVVGKIAIPLILFIIGVIVILNKKITKKTKAIAISILLAIGIFSWIILMKI